MRQPPKRFVPIVKFATTSHALRPTCNNLDFIGNSGEKLLLVCISIFLCAPCVSASSALKFVVEKIQRRGRGDAEKSRIVFHNARSFSQALDDHRDALTATNARRR